MFTTATSSTTVNSGGAGGSLPTTSTSTATTRIMFHHVSQDDLIHLFAQTPVHYDETVCAIQLPSTSTTLMSNGTSGVTAADGGACTLIASQQPPPPPQQQQQQQQHQLSSSATKRNNDQLSYIDESVGGGDDVILTNVNETVEQQENTTTDTASTSKKKQKNTTKSEEKKEPKSESKRPLPQRIMVDPSKKLEILELQRKGMSVARLARQFKVGQQTIRDWMKNEKKLRMLAELNKSSKNSRKTTRGSTYPETDAALNIWYYQQKGLDQPVTRLALSNKAVEFKSKCDTGVVYKPGSKDFEGSSGFIDRFCLRNGIKIEPSNQASRTKQTKRLIAAGVLTHPPQPHNNIPLKDELQRLIQIEGYSTHQLFYMCEAGLVWNALPLQDAAAATAAAVVDNKRVAVALCANCSGDFKLPPLVVAPSNEASISDEQCKKIPYIYALRNDEAWLYHQDFDTWFVDQFVPQVEEYLERNKLAKRAVLFVYRSPAHAIELSFNSIECKFLSAVAQAPCLDSSWLAHLKREYRLNLLRDFLSAQSTENSLVEFIEKIDLKYVIKSIVKIWHATERSVITTTWHRVVNPSYQPPSKSTASGTPCIKSENLLSDELKQWADKYGLSEADLVEWFQVDANVAGHGLLDDEQILRKVVADHKRRNNNNNNSVDESMADNENNDKDEDMTNDESETSTSSVLELISHLDATGAPKLRDPNASLAGRVLVVKPSPQPKTSPSPTKPPLSISKPNRFDLSNASSTPKDIISICSMIEKWIDSLAQPDARLYLSLEYIRSAASKQNLLSLTSRQLS